MTNQNKYKIIALLILIAVLIIGEIAIVFSNKININSKPKYIKGIAKAEYKLIDYKPIIKIIGSLSEEEKNNLKNFSDIDYINGTTLLFLKDSFNIDTIKKFVNGKEMFVKAEFTPIGNAFLNNQTANITTPFSLYIKPNIPLNAVVEFEFEAIAENGLIVATGMPKFSYFQKRLSIKGIILNTSDDIYVYIVDFDNRILVKKFNGTINNIVKNITPKKIDYAKYIGEDYIIVNETVNKSEILNDFPNAILEDSYIYSKTLLNLSFAKSVKRIKQCKIRLETQFNLINKEITINCTKEIGDNVNVNINALISGSTILSFNIINVV